MDTLTERAFIGDVALRSSAYVHTPRASAAPRVLSTTNSLVISNQHVMGALRYGDGS
jgi:hypothetical protein